MTDDLRESVASPRLYAWTSTTFALVSSLIAAIGLYGTLLYSATQRRREIAIRVALGAAPARVTRLIARDGFAIATAAIAIGCGAGYAADVLTIPAPVSATRAAKSVRKIVSCVPAAAYRSG